MEPHKEKTVFAGSSKMKELHAQNWVLAHLGCTIYTFLDTCGWGSQGVCSSIWDLVFTEGYFLNDAKAFSCLPREVSSKELHITEITSKDLCLLGMQNQSIFIYTYIICIDM